MAESRLKYDSTDLHCHLLESWRSLKQTPEAQPINLIKPEHAL